MVQALNFKKGGARNKIRYQNTKKILKKKKQGIMREEVPVY
jgi:hypothetical protein